MVIMAIWDYRITILLPSFTRMARQCWNFWAPGSPLPQRTQVGWKIIEKKDTNHKIQVALYWPAWSWVEFAYSTRWQKQAFVWLTVSQDFEILRIQNTENLKKGIFRGFEYHKSWKFPKLEMFRIPKHLHLKICVFFTILRGTNRRKQSRSMLRQRHVEA